MNCIISIGVENALWRGGEMQSSPIATPRVAAISRLTLAAGSTPPWPGLAPWLIFSSTILHLIVGRDFGRTFRVENVPSRVARAEIARADLPDDVAAVLAVIGRLTPPSPVSCAKPPFLAPAFSARMALAD